MSILTKFFGRTASEGAAFALGTAVGPVLHPAVQELANAAWLAHAAKPVDAALIAQGVAQGQIEYVWGDAEAKYTGIDSERFKRMVQTFNTGPGVASAFMLWRREIIDEAAFRRAAKREGIEDEWIDDLVQTRNVLLSVAEIAAAVQQGHLPNEGVLPEIDSTIIFPPGYDQPPSPDGAPPSHVPLTQIDIAPVNEAHKSGWSEDRLKVLANLAGLPPGPAELLAMWNRNYIDEESVNAGIREGHMKTKWAHAYKRMRWNVLGAAEYAGLWLRGWISKEAAIRGGELTGTTPEQMELLYKNRGRPMAPVQAFTAWARDAPHPVGEGIPDRPGTFDFQDFKRSIQQSDIRTEYVEALWAIRYAYPPLFQLSRLVLAGAIDGPTAVDWAKKQRYHPDVLDALGKFWAKAPAAAGDSHVGKAEAQLWTTTHRSFIAFESNVTQARRALALLKVPAAAQDQIMVFWQFERDLIRRQLTPAQVKKAYSKPVRNPATGANWTRQDAIAALIERGYSLDDANTFLDE